MFGQIRASSSSPGSLQRPPSKLFKDLPLSIYEETLMKLKLGSQRQLSLPSEKTAQIEINCCVSSSCAGTIPSASKSSQDTGFSPLEEMAMDADCSAESSPGTADSHCMASTRHQRNRNISVLYLFSKYNKSREVVDFHVRK